MLRGISSGGGIQPRVPRQRSSLCASRRQLTVHASAAPHPGGRSIPEAWSLKPNSSGPGQQRQPDLSNPARWQLTGAGSLTAAEQVMACVASLKAHMLGDGSCGSCLPRQQAATPGSHSHASGSRQRGNSGAPEALLTSSSPQHQRSSRAGLDDRQTLLDPLQQAGFISSSKCPTVAGVMAAASVVLVGLVWRSMQQTAQLAELQRLQRQQSQENVQALASLRNRYRHALDDAESSDGTGAAAAAGSPEDFSAEPTQLGDVDQEAAWQYQRFMAGAKAANVPMWSSDMREAGPQMSETELEHQTQMIRSAATDEERAAMEDSELRRQLVDDTINSQLAELSGAPIGRAAREAWRKEQAVLKQQQAERQLQEAAAGVAAPAAGVAEAGDGDGSGGGDDGANPFAISSQAKERFRADDHLFTDAKPRPLQQQGSSWGGLGALLGLVGNREKQQQQEDAAEQQLPRRRGLPAATQPGQAEQQQQGAAACLGGPAEENSAEGEAQMRAQLLGNAAARRPRRAAADATGDEAAAAGQPLQQGGAAEGSPQSEAEMRAQLLASGAARRARRAADAATAAVASRDQDGEAAASAACIGGAASARQRWQRGAAIGDSSGSRNRLQEAVISDMGITAPLVDGAVLRMKAAAEAAAEVEAAARAGGSENARKPPAAVPAADAHNAI